MLPASPAASFTLKFGPTRLRLSSSETRCASTRVCGQSQLPWTIAASAEREEAARPTDHGRCLGCARRVYGTRTRHSVFEAIACIRAGQGPKLYRIHGLGQRKRQHAVGSDPWHRSGRTVSGRSGTVRPLCAPALKSGPCPADRWQSGRMKCDPAQPRHTPDTPSGLSR